MPLPNANDPTQAALLVVVGSIPRGRVATYGQVAELAGLPGQARRVGQLLHRLPQDTDLPWHRVINARGRLSLADNSEARAVQQRRLEDEGLAFDKGRINLAHYQWRP